MVGSDIVTVTSLSELVGLAKATGFSAKTAVVQHPTDGGIFVYNSNRFLENDGVDVINGWVRSDGKGELGGQLAGLRSTAAEIDSVVSLKNEVVFIGDSRCAYGQKLYPKGVSSSDTKGIRLSFMGCGVYTAVGNGTIEYRASDRSMRWSAPSDSFGEWVQITRAGNYTLQSASSDMFINFWVRSFNNLPTTDQTITASPFGSNSTILGATVNVSMTTQVMGKLRNNQPLMLLGAGGADSYDLLELMDYYNEVASDAGGIDVIRIGTNDITISTTASSILDNVLLFFESRLAKGRKLIICGEPARWGVDTSTAMTSEQLAILMAVNNGYKNFCNNNPKSCIYVDLFALSVDTAYKDGRPASSILKDTVHDGALGAVLFGNAIYDAIKQFGMNGDKNYPSRGDTSNKLTIGWMSGTGGAIGTGASGVMPSNFSISRASGSDATVVASILNKTTPYRAYGFSMNITGVTNGNIIQVYNVSPLGIPIANLGKAVGDMISLSLDLEVVSATNITSIQSFIQVDGTTQVKSEIDFLPVAGSFVNGKSIPIKIPAGATTATFYLLVTVGASSSAVINVSDIIVQ